MDCDLQFVDSITASPAVRLDLMLAPWATQSSTTFGMPDLRRAVASTLLTDGERYPASAYSNRLITLVVKVVGVNEAATAGILQQLYRELDRPTNVLMYRPGTSRPVFFRTFRAGPESVTWDPHVREARVSIPAEPFALGLRETLGANALSNTTFESTTAPWTAQNGAVAQSTTVARTGTYSLRLTPTGGVSPASHRSESVPVTAGLPYAATVWLYSPAGWAAGASAAIDWQSGSGSLISSTVGTVSAVPAGAWTRYQTVASAPVGAVTAQIRARMAGTPAATDLLYLDDPSIAQHLVVSNNPAAAINGCYVDLTGIKGDVEAPLFLRVGDDVYGTVYDSRTIVMGVRRRGVPSQMPLVLQAEAMAAATGTTLAAANDPLMSGSGPNYMRVSPSGAAMEQRLVMPLWPAAPSVDVRGRYRVLARMRQSSIGDVWSVQLAYGANATLPIRNTPARVTQSATIAYYDLGTIQLPVGADPVTDGYSGVEAPVGGTRLAVWAQRVSGTGTLDIDVLMFVPADDRYSITRMWSDPSASGGIIDGLRHMVYAVDGSGAIQMPAQPEAPIGGLPMLSPGVTNRIVFLPDGGSVRDILSSTSTITPYYWPRYLYVRPVAS